METPLVTVVLEEYTFESPPPQGSLTIFNPRWEFLKISKQDIQIDNGSKIYLTLSLEDPFFY
jgi:hypothetical protein